MLYASQHGSDRVPPPSVAALADAGNQRTYGVVAAGIPVSIPAMVNTCYQGSQ